MFTVQRDTPTGTPGQPNSTGISPTGIPGQLSPTDVSLTHPPPAQFALAPLHTHHNAFHGEYVVSSHPSQLQNHPSQPHMYYGCHPLESSPYPPSRYYLPGYQPLPYFHHRSNVQGRNPSYQHLQRLPLPMHQSATGSPGPSHPGSYGTRPYMPPHTSTGHFGLPQQYQPNVYQWYHVPGTPADTFNKAAPIQVQQRYPINYSLPRTQRLHKDYTTVAAQSTASEYLPSPSAGPSSRPIAATVSRNSISPPPVDTPERTFVQSPSTADTHELSNTSAATPSHTHDHPLVRRHYHPNPPPKRSEWVMWVGNVPSDTTHDELWRFLTHSAPLSPGSNNTSRVKDSGVKSIFLISRSNCAFVNYRSEEHLILAIPQFNGRKLRSHDPRCPRFVCRARRKEDDLRAGVGAQRGIGIHTQYVKNVLHQDNESGVEKAVLPNTLSTTSDPLPAPLVSKNEEILKPGTVGVNSPTVPTRSGSYASTTSSVLVHHFPKRFFILKSLTQVGPLPCLRS